MLVKLWPTTDRWSAGRFVVHNRYMYTTLIATFLQARNIIIFLSDTFKSALWSTCINFLQSMSISFASHWLDRSSTRDVDLPAEMNSSYPSIRHSWQRITTWNFTNFNEIYQSRELSYFKVLGQFRLVIKNFQTTPVD